MRRHRTATPPSTCLQADTSNNLMRVVSTAAPASHSQTRSQSATATQSGTGSPSAHATPSSSRSKTQSATASGAATATPSPSQTITPSLTLSVSPSQGATPSQSPTPSLTQTCSPSQGATLTPPVANTAPGEAPLHSAGLIAGAVVGAFCAAAAVVLAPAVYVTRRRPRPPRGCALALATCCGAWPLRRWLVTRGSQVKSWAGPETRSSGVPQDLGAVEMTAVRMPEPAISVSELLRAASAKAASAAAVRENNPVWRAVESRVARSTTSGAAAVGRSALTDSGALRTR